MQTLVTTRITTALVMRTNAEMCVVCSFSFEEAYLTCNAWHVLKTRCVVAMLYDYYPAPSKALSQKIAMAIHQLLIHPLWLYFQLELVQHVQW